MNGKIVGGGIVLIGAIAGIAMYWLQVYGFYEEVRVGSPAAAIRLTPVAGAPEEIIVAGFEGIDADSSPLRFRGCLTTPTALATLTETYTVYENPTPLIAPGWFSCFDAGKLTEDLASGEAVAFLSEANIHPGIDRVVAVYPDGRAFAWHQLNQSAEN